jgi:methylglutaconyl-CoA hydratase
MSGFPLNTAMDYTTLALNRRPHGVLEVTLNRPETHNAMSITMIRELRDLCDALSAQNDTRAVVLTGAGRSFCAGADLRWMQEISQQSREARMREARELAEMLHALDTLPALTLARVNGPAFGGAVGVISCCDLAVASENAVFALTEVRLGILPATISPFVVRRLGGSQARRVMLHARRFDAEEALRLGLLSRVVAVEDLDEAVEAEVQLLLACAPESVGRTKQLIRQVEGQLPEDVRDLTIDQLADVWEHPSSKEGISAFFEKRPPAWKPE